jgi:hypothetical protein
MDSLKIWNKLRKRKTDKKQPTWMRLSVAWQLFTLTIVEPECYIRICWKWENPLSEPSNGKSIKIMPSKIGMNCHFLM